jgi:hypothetical protein
MELRAGQEWTYRGRPADSTSTLVILEVEHGPGLQPIHVCLTGVRVPTRVAGQDTNVVHLAISDYQLPKELGRLVGEHAQPNSLCDAGRRTWLAQKPYPGVWGGSIRGYISTVASRVRPVAPPHEPRTCVLNRPRDEADTTYARRCAEAFIAQNGYTSATGVVDTSLVVPEFLDMGGVEDILEHRHGQLEPRAESAGPGLDGWGVGFRYASDPSGCTLRVVLMKSDFTGMRMVHEDAGPASDTEQGRVCAKRRAGS